MVRYDPDLRATESGKCAQRRVIDESLLTTLVHWLVCCCFSCRVLRFLASGAHTHVLLGASNSGRQSCACPTTTRTTAECRTFWRVESAAIAHNKARTYLSCSNEHRSLGVATGISVLRRSVGREARSHRRRVRARRSSGQVERSVLCHAAMSCTCSPHLITARSGSLFISQASIECGLCGLYIFELGCKRGVAVVGSCCVDEQLVQCRVCVCVHAGVIDFELDWTLREPSCKRALLPSLGS